MLKIIKLSAETIGHIAAGEVVERPSAAVKELVENSMDAGASSITVDIKEGGLDLIRVTDNGSGIAQSELKMAFERHATSKLRSQEDLTHIATLGFRGEALSAIAAVSKVSLLTRLRGEESGMLVENIGGLITDIRPAPCAEGTSITVKDLFFSAPVRRKFMKKPSQEAQMVADLMQKLILSHPDISFRFVADGKQVFFSPGDGKLESAVMSVYGISTLRELIQVQGNEQGLIISGYVGIGELSRGNRSQQLFFVNGRSLRSTLLSQALEEACRQRVMIGRFPLCLLFLSLPYEAVDVNVHPNKWEVRFADERKVQDAVTKIVADALSPGAADLTPPPLYPPPKSEPGVPVRQMVRQDAALHQNQPVAARAAFPASSMSLRSSAWEKADSGLVTQDKVDSLPPQQVHAAETLPELALRPVKLLGVAFNTYILFESGDTICLCDQHAMHERLMFDKLMQAYESGGISQTLLIPGIIELSFREHGTFLEYQALLAAAGFEAEDFGEGSVKLHGVPILLGQPQGERSFKEALDELSQTGNLSDDKRIEKIIMASCKGAVKGGERLTDEALIALVRGVLDGNVKPTCPHGRPLMMQLTRTELEKRFQRIPN